MKAAQPDPTRELWERYWQTRSVENRNRVVEAYLPLVHLIASKLTAHRRMRGCIDCDDFVIAGAEGLMKAIARFDPSRKVKFATYATLLIRGAMFDQMREVDWVPRLTRRRDPDGEHVKRMGSLDAPPPPGGLVDPDPEYIADPKQGNPGDAVESRDTIKHLTRGLPMMDRAILDMYYGEGKSMWGIGKELDVTESCVSLRHSAAILRMHEKAGMRG